MQFLCCLLVTMRMTMDQESRRITQSCFAYGIILAFFLCSIHVAKQKQYLAEWPWVDKVPHQKTGTLSLCLCLCQTASAASPICSSFHSTCIVNTLRLLDATTPP